MIKIITFAICAFYIIGCAGPEPVAAEMPDDKRPIEAEDLWNMKRTGAPEVSPDGRYVVFPVTKYDIEENSSSTNLYIYDRSDDEGPRKFTSSGSDNSPVWSPDGEYIAFISGRDDGPAQLYKIAAEGGEAQRVTDLPVGVSAPKWFPDGEHIAFTADIIPGYDGDFDIPKEMLEEEEADQVSAKTTENRIYRHWDRWLTDGKYPRIFKADLAGDEITDLMPGAQKHFAMMGAAEYDISPDGQQIAVSANSNPEPYEYLNYAIYLLPTDGSGEMTNITEENPANDLRPQYSPDGSTLLYGKRTDPEFYADRIRMVYYDLETEERTIIEEVVNEGIDLSPSGWKWSTDGEWVFFSAQDRGKTSLFQVEPGTDNLTEIFRGGTNGNLSYTGESIMFTHQSLTQPPELYEIDAPGEEPRQVSRFNDEIMEEIQLGEVENMTYEGADGVEIQQYIIYPPEFDPDEEWPMVKMIHGGPHGIFGDDFHFRWNAQLFAAPGHVVVMPNFHGSSSFGQEFTKSIHGEHADLPFRDIMKSTDDMLERGYIDEDRMAATGGSYGGYMVSWIAGHTDRYSALINHAGVYDITMQFAADVTYHRPAQYSGSPWENQEEMRKWNPAEHAENFETPMLIIHGEKDYRVPLTHGLKVYGVYKGQGLDARLVYYPDENHWILSPQNSIHWFGEFHDWLDRWIGTGPTE